MKHRSNCAAKLGRGEMTHMSKAANVPKASGVISASSRPNISHKGMVTPDLYHSVDKGPSNVVNDRTMGEGWECAVSGIKLHAPNFRRNNLWSTKDTRPGSRRYHDKYFQPRQVPTLERDFQRVEFGCVRGHTCSSQIRA